MIVEVEFQIKLLNICTIELTDMIKTGEILRKTDGNYCFSCNHCSKHFDNIHAIIYHMNKLQIVSGQIVSKRKDKLGDTEFVDVSTALEVKYESVEEEDDDGHVNDVVNDLGDMGDMNYVCNVLDPTVSTFSLRNVCTTYKTSQKCLESTLNDNASMPKGRDKNEKETLKTIEPALTASRINIECDQEYLLKCCWCSESFSDFGLIFDHFTDAHNKKPSDIHSCEKCRIFFKNMKLLGEHILLRHGQQLQEAYKIECSTPIQCAVCNSWTLGNKSFDAHTKRVHKMYRILQCYICRIFKKKPSGLIDHLKVHDRFRKYRCYECDNVEPKITNPYDSRSHKCVLCNIWFFNHATIRNHIANVHQQDQIYDCSICDNYTFKTEMDLKTHTIDVHKIPMDFKCKFCSKSCKSMPSLKEHQKSHLTKSNLNLCTICGSKFRRKDYLLRDIQSHGKINKDFTCYICKKQFQSNGYLKNHIKRHTEKKMHVCDVCGNRFLLAGLLRKHMKEHEGEVWKCEQCSKAFSNKSKLTAHEKTHVTERNFTCDVCHKSYKTSKNLRQHRLVHSAERRIKCRICNMTFNQAEHILHLQTHTNDVI